MIQHILVPLFGSVVDELIRNSGKPVLVIKSPKN